MDWLLVLAAIKTLQKSQQESTFIAHIPLRAGWGCAQHPPVPSTLPLSLWEPQCQGGRESWHLCSWLCTQHLTWTLLWAWPYASNLNPQVKGVLPQVTLHLLYTLHLCAGEEFPCMDWPLTGYSAAMLHVGCLWDGFCTCWWPQQCYQKMSSAPSGTANKCAEVTLQLLTTWRNLNSLLCSQMCTRYNPSPVKSH